MNGLFQSSLVAGLAYWLGTAGCLVLTAPGCIGYHLGGDTNTITRHITDTMQHSEPVSIPLGLADPALAGYTLNFSTLPNKDVSFIRHPDGTIEYTSNMSEGVTKLFAGALGLNAAAFTEAGSEREFVERIIDKLLAALQAQLAASAATPSSPTTGGGGSQFSPANVQAWIDYLRSLGVQINLPGQPQTATDG